MTRKLLPAMIGTILVGGMATAQADVTLFGQIDESINRIDDLNGNSDTRLVCTTCSLGVKGSEDLGNGLKAIFKLDWQYNINERNTSKASAKTTRTTTIGGSIVTNITDVSDDSTFTDRDQWLGLAGNFGQVRVGTISTTYKSTGAMLDPGYRTVAQMRDAGIQSGLHSGAGTNGQGRAENTARYDSPSWNGLKFAATFTLSPENENDNENPYSAGLSYENGGILLFGNYITNERGGDNSAWKVGGKYTLNNFSVFGQFEKDGGLITARRRGTIKSDNSLNGDDANQWMAGASYTMGNNMIYAAYAAAEGMSGNAAAAAQPAFGNDDYKAYEIVGIHNMSKRTFLYAGYVKTDPDQSGVDDTTIWTSGVRHKF
ncbi:MAG: porin [Pseudomonadota bacterium]|nr:porin [Pseudomonadota bacterium]